MRDLVVGGAVIAGIYLLMRRQPPQADPTGPPREVVPDVSPQARLTRMRQVHDSYVWKYETKVGRAGDMTYSLRGFVIGNADGTGFNTQSGQAGSDSFDWNGERYTRVSVWPTEEEAAANVTIPDFAPDPYEGGGYGFGGGGFGQVEGNPFEGYTPLGGF